MPKRPTPKRTKPPARDDTPPPELPATIPTSSEPDIVADPQEVFDRSVGEYEADARRETGEPRPVPSHPPDLPEKPPKKKKKKSRGG